MDFVHEYLRYDHYSIGYGRYGKIPNAICVTPDELKDTVHDLSHRRYNIYIRPNADFYYPKPARIRDADIIHPTIYVIDVDSKDNPGADIETALIRFITEQGLTDYLLMNSGHGCQLWLRCDPVDTVEQFRSIARRLKGWIEAETELVVDFVPNPSRYGRYPGSMNFNEPIRQGRVISVECGEPLKMDGLQGRWAAHRQGAGGFPQEGRGQPKVGGLGCVDKGAGEHHPHPPDVATPGSLLTVRSAAKRARIMEILRAVHPTHSERLWLVGFLRFCGMSTAKILRVIDEANHWGDYDSAVTRKHVRSVRGR